MSDKDCRFESTIEGPLTNLLNLSAEPLSPNPTGIENDAGMLVFEAKNDAAFTCLVTSTNEMEASASTQAPNAGSDIDGGGSRSSLYAYAPNNNDDMEASSFSGSFGLIKEINLGGREREMSSVGDVSMRSALKQAKRERRQKAKEGDTEQAFAGSNAGDSCDDEGMEEIVALPTRGARRSSENAWAAPLVNLMNKEEVESPQPSVDEKPRSKRDNLRRGKRQLMSGWCQDLDNQKRETQVMDWISTLGPGNQTPMTSVPNSPQRAPATPADFEAMSLTTQLIRSGSLMSDVLDYHHPTLPPNDSAIPMSSSVMYSQQTAKYSPSSAFNNTPTTTPEKKSALSRMGSSAIIPPSPRRAQVVHPPSTSVNSFFTQSQPRKSSEPHITALLSLRSIESDSPSRNSTSLQFLPHASVLGPPEGPNENSVSNSSVRHARPRDTIRSIQLLRNELSDDTSPERSPHNAIRTARSDSPAVLSGPSDQPTGSSSNIESPALGASSVFDASLSAQNISGLRLQPGCKPRHVVTMNDDVYNLNTWDSVEFGLFALPTDTLFTPSTQQPPRRAEWSMSGEISNVPGIFSPPEINDCPESVPSKPQWQHHVEPSSSLTVGVGPLSNTPLCPPIAAECVDGGLQSPPPALSVLEAYFKEPRSLGIVSPRDEDRRDESISMISEAFAFARGVGGEVTGDMHASRLFNTQLIMSSRRTSASVPHQYSVTPASHSVSMGARRSNLVLPEYRCRAYLKRIQAQHFLSATTSILQCPIYEAPTVRREVITQGWSLSSNVEDVGNIVRCGSLASVDYSKGGLSTTVGKSPRADLGPYGNLSTPFVVGTDPRRPSMSLARTFGGAGRSFSSVGVVHQQTRTFSDVAARYVSVDTLIHEASAYTQQLANPTSGAGHRSFRREQEGRFATTTNNSLVSTGDAFDDETLVTSPS